VPTLNDKYQARLVRYDLLGAKRGPITDLGFTVNLADGEESTVTFTVSRGNAAGFPDAFEVALEVWDRDRGFWVEDENCRFIVTQNDDDDERSPSSTKSLQGEQLWPWLLKRAVLEDVDIQSVTNRPSTTERRVDGLLVKGNLFTKSNHGLGEGQRVRLSSQGNYKGSGGLKGGNYYYVRSVTTNTFRLSSSRNGGASTTGNEKTTYSGLAVSTAVYHVFASGHGYKKNDKVRFVTTGTAQNVQTGKDYYVVDPQPDRFALSSQAAGAGIILGVSTGMTIFKVQDGKRRFTRFEAGRLVKYAMDEAQQRGWAPAPLDYSFTSTTDTAGSAWPSGANGVTMDFEAGTNLWTIVQALRDAGELYPLSRGRTLDLRKFDAEVPPKNPNVKVALQAGTVQVKRDSSDAVSDVTVRGDNRILVRVAQGLRGALLPLVRSEKYVRASGVGDTNQARRIGVKEIAGLAGTLVGYEVREFPNSVGAYRPLIDYRLRSFVGFQRGGQSNTGRILELQLTKNASGEMSVVMHLDWRRRSTVNRNIKSVKRLTNSQVQSGNGSLTAMQSSNRMPAAPTVTVVPKSGTWKAASATAAAVVAYEPVLVDVDGADADVKSYEVWTRSPEADQPQLAGVTQSLSYELQGLRSGQQYLVSVRGLSSDGALGELSDEVELISGMPDNELEAPTPPVLTSRLGMVSATWDGLAVTAADGQTIAPDSSLAFVVAQTAASEGGEYVDAGQQLPSKGTAQLPGFASGATVWVRFVAVDQAGKRSDPSAAQSIVVAAVVTEDFSEEVNKQLEDAKDGLAEADQRLDASEIAVQEANALALDAQGTAFGRVRHLTAAPTAATPGTTTGDLAFVHEAASLPPVDGFYAWTPDTAPVDGFYTLPTEESSTDGFYEWLKDSSETIGVYQWTADNKWVVRPIGDAAVANLDVGKLTAGSATIGSAVIGKIAAQSASIQQVDVRNLFVTGTAAMDTAVIDKLFADVVKAKTLITTEAFIGKDALLDGSVTARSVEAGAIDGLLITGATMQTAASGPRLVLSSSTFTGYANSGNEFVRLDPRGGGLLMLENQNDGGTTVKGITWYGGGFVATHAAIGDGGALSAPGVGWTKNSTDEAPFLVYGSPTLQNGSVERNFGFVGMSIGPDGGVIITSQSTGAAPFVQISDRVTLRGASVSATESPELVVGTSVRDIRLTSGDDNPASFKGGSLTVGREIAIVSGFPKANDQTYSGQITASPYTVLIRGPRTASKAGRGEVQIDPADAVLTVAPTVGLTNRTTSFLREGEFRVTNGHIVASGVGQFGQSYDQIVSGRPVVISTTGILGYAGSKRDLKSQLKPITVDEAVTDRMLDLQPTSYVMKVKYDTRRERQRQLGFIAEDVHAAGFTELVDYGSDDSGEMTGTPEALYYDRFVSQLWAWNQYQEKRIRQLEQQATASNTNA
jgi:hypothetical protein